MKTKKIQVSVHKQIGKDKSEWGLTYGVEAELDKKEDFEQALKDLTIQLKGLISNELPIHSKNVDWFNREKL